MKACFSLNLNRATYYKVKNRPEHPEKKEKKPSHRALSKDERDTVFEVLNSEKYVDKSPYQVFASLLDEGTYLCCVSTMYRLLRENKQIRERRNQLRHPKYTVPVLKASKPNQVWTWDITKLPGSVKWKSYYLYVILDMFSRYVVGFMIAEKENSELAKQLIEKTYRKQNVKKDDLILHADRGTQMTSKAVSQLLSDLGIEQSHSRPRVSNDNAFSESQFKTLKTRPSYPGHFESLEAARLWSRMELEWYNFEHHHESIGWMTPHQVHHGLADELTKARQITLEAAMNAHPERFVRGFVKAPQPPKLVTLNSFAQSDVE